MNRSQMHQKLQTYRPKDMPKVEFEPEYEKVVDLPRWITDLIEVEILKLLPNPKKAKSISF